jgi:hypothetical protein
VIRAKNSDNRGMVIVMVPLRLIGCAVAAGVSIAIIRMVVLSKRRRRRQKTAMEVHLDTLLNARRIGDVELSSALNAVGAIVRPLLREAPRPKEEEEEEQQHQHRQKRQQQHRRSLQPLVIVEGLDGVGKTTLKRTLDEKLLPKVYGSPCAAGLRTTAVFPAFGRALAALESRLGSSDVVLAAFASIFPLGNFAMAAKIGTLRHTHVVAMDRFWASSVCYAAARASGELPSPSDQCAWTMPAEMAQALADGGGDLCDDDTSEPHYLDNAVCLMLVTPQGDDGLRGRRLAERGEEATDEEARIATDPRFRARLIEAFNRVRLPMPIVFVDASGGADDVAHLALSKVCGWSVHFTFEWLIADDSFLPNHKLPRWCGNARQR